MESEPRTPPSGSQGPPEAAPEAEEKPKRKPRRPAESRPQGLPTTEAGARVADQVRQKLIEMVDAAAMTVANRRRATGLDETDYEEGFDITVGPAKRIAAVAIVADVANALGSGLIGYAINVYTGTGTDLPRGHLALFGGGALLALSIILKYVTHGK